MRHEGGHRERLGPGHVGLEDVEQRGVALDPELEGSGPPGCARRPRAVAGRPVPSAAGRKDPARAGKRPRRPRAISKSSMPTRPVRPTPADATRKRAAARPPLRSKLVRPSPTRPHTTRPSRTCGGPGSIESACLARGCAPPVLPRAVPSEDSPCSWVATDRVSTVLAPAGRPSPSLSAGSFFLIVRVGDEYRDVKKMPAAVTGDPWLPLELRAGGREG